MKKYSAASLFILFLFTSCHKKEQAEINEIPIEPSCTNILDKWDIESKHYPDGIQKQQDIYFPTDEVGYSVGNAGSILKTVDGGAQWDVLEFYYLPETGINPNALTKAGLQSVFFIDELTGFVGGAGEISLLDDINTDAVLLKTINGGASWGKSYLNGVRKIYDLLFFDENRGLGLFSVETAGNSSELKLQKTENGGLSWSNIDLPVKTINSYSFIRTENKIILLGSDANDSPILLTSKNKGLNWGLKSIPETVCNRIYFIDDNNGFASCGLLFFPESTFKTTDGGSTWNRIEPSLNFYSLIHFNTAEEGFIINPIVGYVSGGGELTPEIQHFEVLQTSNGGTNWQKSTIDKTCDLMGVSYASSAGNFYSLGQAGHKFRLK